ncbi:translocation/assembly module TamB domain-containing protein [Desulfoferrobacter suflitae]|uniref:translocation/assembly module TamB domain-containing protein n=1 Tax=Desulfoferrobacter suflitae TaxID=2865782 RepID=UPI002164B99C|nr:translocation/assembly module TamB domain-containing protein [Desulfoferrobacter suflitae]MCK8602256.1 translocation/assembly module TamB domain-containing protein [Desulfoferrobacter suflitae]
MEQEEKPAKRRVLRWLVISCSSMILLLLMVFGLIQTSAVKEQISSRLSKLLSSSPDQQIYIGELQGFIPFTIRIDQITLGDRKGTWLTLDKLLFRWSPLALLHGAIHVDAISAAKLAVQRAPHAPPGEEEEKPQASEPFKLPEALPNVMVEQLTVAELSLGRELLGHAGSFHLRGSVDPLPDAAGIEALVHLTRLDAGPETRVQLSAQLRTSPSRLSVDFTFYEDPAGWVASVANIEDSKPLELTLQGAGPLNDWQGKLSGAAGPYGALQTSIGLNATDPITLALKGKYSIGSLIDSPQLNPLLGSGIDFDFLGRAQPSERAEITQFTIRVEKTRANLAGEFDFKKQHFKSRFDLTMDNLNVLEALAGTPLAGTLALAGSFAGPVHQPHGELSAVLHEVQAQGYRLDSAETKLQLAPLDRDATSFSGVTVSGEGKAEGLASLAGKGLPEQDLHWNLNGKVQGDRTVSIESFNITGKQLRFKLAGDYDPESMAGKADVDLQIDDLRPVTSLVGEPLPGSLSLAANFTGDGRSRSAAGHLQGLVRTAAGFPEKIAALLGQQTAFSAEFDLAEGARLEVPDLRIESSVFQLGATLSADLTGNTVLAGWQLEVPDLAPLTPLAGRTLSGSMRSEGDLEGPLDAARATVTVQGNRIALDDLKLEKIQLDAGAENLPKSPHGEVTLTLQKKSAQIKAATAFSLQERQLALQPLTLQAPGTELQGELTADLEKTLVKGYLKAKIKNLSELGRFLEQTMAGSGALDVELTPGKKGQDVKALLNAKGLSTPFAKLRQLDLSADLQDVLAAPQGSAVVKLKDFESSDLTIRELDLKASGGEQGMTFQTTIKGRSMTPFSLTTKGFVGLAGEQKKIRIDTFTGKLDEYPIKLFKPLTVSMETNRLALDSLALGLGRGKVQGSGRMGDRQVKLEAGFDDIPLELSSLFGGPDISGSAQGRVQLSGASTSPRAELDLRLRDVRSAEPDLKDLPPLQLTALARLQQNALSLTSELQGLTEKPAKATVKVPATFSLEPFAFTLPENGTIDGRLDLEANLARVSRFVPLDAQILAGRAVASVGIGGRMAAPLLNGFLALTDVSYQNFVTGTVLKHLNARIVADGQQFTIENFQATDGGSGSIKASGRVNVDQEKNFPVDLNLTLMNATLVRRPDATAQVDGNIAVAGSAAAMDVTGNLRVAPAEINLPQRLPAEMTELNVIEIHGKNGNGKTPQEAEAPTSAPVKLALNIQVNLPNRIYVRGWGLDSEWRGKLDITGTADKPSIVGSLSSIRGKVDFLNKSFDIVRGTITFFGSSPPMPNVDIVAESKVKDITAKIAFTGPAANPEMVLSSTPPLPSDEVLAKLLFGRSATEITPSQALQLAMIARSLTGAGGAGGQRDFMSRTRKFLGVDTLEFNSAGEGLGSGTVGVGKYLTEGVRLDVEKGIGEGANKASIEVEVTPNITVESEVGSDSTSGIGVNWKYDY